MHIIICLDERRGLLFNHRRQSKDRELIADVGRNLTGSLFIKPYSEPLFAGREIPYRCVERVEDAIGENSVFFAEDLDFLSVLDSVDTVTVYWWNRHYPSDVRLETDLLAEGFTSVCREDFVGFSHENITKEILKR